MDGAGEPGRGRPRDVGAAQEREGPAVSRAGAHRLGGRRTLLDVLRVAGGVSERWFQLNGLSLEKL